jgi:hypothetical protein
VRRHIRTQQQLKLHIDITEDKLEATEAQYNDLDDAAKDKICRLDEALSKAYQ